MHTELKQKAINLRTKKQLSYNAILAQIPVAKSTLHEWLKFFPLSNERISELRGIAWKKKEGQIELFRATMKKKREEKDKIVYSRYLKKFKRVSNKSMFIAGLMLYLAEGSKKNEYKLTLTNTDPKIIKFFINWMYNFFKYPKDKIKIFLQLYPNMNMEKELFFWENELKLSRSQFYRPFIRQLRPSSFSYQESFRHGTCAAIVASTEKRREVSMACRAFLDSCI